MPKRQIFEWKQTPGLAARKQGAEEDEYHIRHDEYSFAQGSQEIKDSYGLRGFRYPHITAALLLHRIRLIWHVELLFLTSAQ
jgi:hypothetical protein